MKTLYKELTGKRKEIEKLTPIFLYNHHFSEGTLLLDKPGYYVLKENIIFNPNPNDDYFPRANQSQYQIPGFSLGFFAVIAVYTDGVYLDLNGFTISASKEFALQQRFFSIIELANAPFIPLEGPSVFSTPSSFKSAENVIIRAGKLGLSSHHGIHGNMASNILIENLSIENFEFVGIALNGGGCVLMHKVEIRDNRKDIPVLGTYSAARFARMFAKRVLSIPQVSASYKNELANRLASLEAEMNQTFQEVRNGQAVSSPLFRNESGLPDGNLMGVIIKNRGFAVNELVTPDPSVVKTNNVFLRKVQTSNLKCRVDEIIGLSQKGGAGINVDIAGAVLSILKIQDGNGVYKGTVLSAVQLYLAEIALAYNLTLGKNNIGSEVIEWSKSGQSIKTLLKKDYFYKCGADSMNHMNKFLASYRFDALNNLMIDKCSYDKIKNVACMGCEIKGCKMHDSSKRGGEYAGSGCVGLNLAYCSNVFIHKFKGDKCTSKDGNATGINVIFGCENVKVDEVNLRDIKAGTLHNGKWIGKSFFGKNVKYEDGEVNKKPIAVGIRYEKGSIVDMKDVEIHDLRSCAEPIKILKY